MSHGSFRHKMQVTAKRQGISQLSVMQSMTQANVQPRMHVVKSLVLYTRIHTQARTVDASSYAPTVVDQKSMELAGYWESA